MAVLHIFLVELAHLQNVTCKHKYTSNTSKRMRKIGLSFTQGRRSSHSRKMQTFESDLRGVFIWTAAPLLCTREQVAEVAGRKPTPCWSGICSYYLVLGGSVSTRIGIVTLSCQRESAMAGLFCFPDQRSRLRCIVYATKKV